MRHILVKNGPTWGALWSTNNRPTSDFKATMVAGDDPTSVFPTTGYLELSHVRSYVFHCVVTITDDGPESITPPTYVYSPQWPLSLCFRLLVHACYISCSSHPPSLNYCNYIWRRV
jgi:hypothetical protein